MGVGIVDFPNPFPALIEANAAAGARSGAEFQSIIGNAAALQEFERREVQTDQQRQTFNELQRVARRDRQEQATARVAIGQRFQSSFAIPFEGAYSDRNYGRAVMLAENARSVFQHSGSERVEEAVGKTWALANVPDLRPVLNTMAHSMNNTLIDMRDIKGQDFETSRMRRPLSELASVAQDDEDVARWMVSTVPEAQRLEVAQHFGYAYERDRSGNVQLLKEGTQQHDAWLARNEALTRFAAQGLSPAQSRAALEQQGRILADRQAALSRAAAENPGMSPELLRQSVDAGIMARDDGIMGDIIVSRGGSALDVLNTRLAARAANNPQFSADDLSQELSNMRRSSQTPEQNEFIDNIEALTLAQTELMDGKLVYSGAAVPEEAPSRIVQTRSRLRELHSPPIDNVARTAETEATPRRQFEKRSQEILLGALGDPLHTATFQEASTPGNNLRVIEGQMDLSASRRAIEVRRFLRSVNGLPPDAVAQSSIQEQFDTIEGVLVRNFSLSGDDAQRLLAPYRNPDTLPVEEQSGVAVVADARARAGELMTRNAQLAQIMETKGDAVPGSDAFTAQTVGVDVFGAAAGAGARRATAAAAVARAGAEAATAETELQVRETDLLRKIVEGGGLEGDDLEEAQELLSQRTRVLGLGVPDPSAFGAALGSERNPFDTESDARRAFGSLPSGTQVFARNADGDLVSTRVP